MTEGSVFPWGLVALVRPAGSLWFLSFHSQRWTRSGFMARDSLRTDSVGAEKREVGRTWLEGPFSPPRMHVSVSELLAEAQAPPLPHTGRRTHSCPQF